MNPKRLRIGFIPLCDATALIVAVDKGFAAAEGLDVELCAREVSMRFRFCPFFALHKISADAVAMGIAGPSLAICYAPDNRDKQL